MIIFLIGSALAYAALAASSLLISTDTWWETHPTASAAILTLGLVPLLATWAAAELARSLRAPRLLTPYAGKAKRAVSGLTAGVVSSCVGALAVVLLEPTTGGAAWLLMGVSAFLATFALLWLARPLKRGHCRRCEYDLAGVTPAAHGRCPECGVDVMVAA